MRLMNTRSGLQSVPLKYAGSNCAFKVSRLVTNYNFSSISVEK
jgi:hypothetical protein